MIGYFMLQALSFIVSLAIWNLFRNETIFIAPVITSAIITYSFWKKTKRETPTEAKTAILLGTCFGLLLTMPTTFVFFLTN